MLVGCLVRHFKVYQNIVFTPITLGFDGNFSVFTGNNGVGKSSILEAVDHFFHQTKWIVNNKGNKGEAFIAPIFLIAKTEFTSTLSSNILNAISDYFWNVSENFNPTVSKNESIKEFLTYRDDLRKLYDSDLYYLFLVGMKHPNDAPHFITFDSDLKSNLVSKGLDTSELDKMHKAILNFYSYVYIPVESTTQNLLKLGSFELQEFMDRDVLDEIDGILNDKITIQREAIGLSRGPKNISFSPLKHINDKLNKFIEEANTSIQKLGPNYIFSTEINQKRNLSVQDIRDRILDEYFSIRVLKKDGKLIEDLSSGEQRIALFDIAYSLLSQGKRTKKKLILAIDEPESSMHMSQCYRQFLRLNEISSKFGHQVLITSHWYGFLPVIENGYINHIDHDDGLKISQHALRSVTSKQKYLPDEISLKSIFDLVSSVIGMMRTDTANWLVCEGIDDQFYLKEFLKDKIKNLYILPMGGISNVVKLYNYLYVPLSEKNEKKSISGKVVCLTDTDKQPIYPDNNKSIAGGSLTLRRFDLNLNDFKLIELNQNSQRHITVIEDLLDANIFYDACHFVVANSGDPNLIHNMANLTVSPNMIYTGYSSELSGYEDKVLDAGRKRRKELMVFLSQHDIKYRLASKYVEIFNTKKSKPPQWITDVINLFSDKSATKSKQSEE
jgi:AAA ATPase domain